MSSWSTFTSGLTNVVSNVAATAVQMTRDALEEDETGGAGPGSEASVDSSERVDDIQAYKTVIEEMELRQLQLSRDLQRDFRAKQVRPTACPLLLRSHALLSLAKSAMQLTPFDVCV